MNQQIPEKRSWGIEKGWMGRGEGTIDKFGSFSLGSGHFYEKGSVLSTSSVSFELDLNKQ